MYIPTLKANWMLWPAVQVINFRLMPIQFQVVSLPTPPLHMLLIKNQPFVSSVGIAWTAYLSLTNAAEDVTEARSAPRNASFELS
jgi:protein Mpv17